MTNTRECCNYLREVLLACYAWRVPLYFYLVDTSTTISSLVPHHYLRIPIVAIFAPKSATFHSFTHVNNVSMGFNGSS